MSLSTTDLDRRFALGTTLAREAGLLALGYFAQRHELEVEAKGLQDLVSVADRAVEDLIRARLAEAFPQDGILGEEGGGDLASALWVIDPIDGTSNFLRGVPYWCTVLAFTIDGETVMGFTHDPVHDELFVARKGHGSTRDGRPIAVSGRAPEQGCVGLSFNFKTDGPAYLAVMERLTEARLDHRRLGSSALSLVHVADGRMEGFICLDCASWDVIAGLLTVEEAGGVATRYTAGGATLKTRKAVAAAVPQIEATLAHASGLAW